MNSPSPSITTSRRTILQSAIMVIIIILLAGSMGIYVLADKDLRRAFEFVNLAMQIQKIYLGELNWNQLYTSARNSMFSELDRYSYYIDRRDFQRLDEEFEGSYGGIGVSVISHDNGLMIMSVRENGPAAEVGLLNGDIILAADSVLLKNLSADKATDLLRGEPGSKVLVRIFRPVLEDTLELAVTREKIPLLHIPFAGFTPDSMLYIRLFDFEGGASDDIEAALDSLLTDDKPPARGIILDLRDNPGGLFQEACKTADLFLDKGKLIVGTDSRSIWKEEKYYSKGHDKTHGLPMAIIVDRGSASASEIVAGALKQNGRAVLVGDTTFGKGLVQGFTRFPDGSGLRLTISRYYLEGGVYLNEFDSTLNEIGRGLPPDYYFKFTERRRFPRVLENTLLLQEFAIEHQDEIIRDTRNFILSDQWLDDFEKFTREKNFVYESEETKIAELLVDMAHFRSEKPDQLLSIAEQVLHRSQKNDMNRFSRYKTYIKRRLQQIALERKYGTYEAYARAIVPNRADIIYTSHILEETP